MGKKEQLYIVQRIVGRRKTKTGAYEYKIKWKGWSASQSTWQPREHLQYIEALVKKYDTNIQKRKLIRKRAKIRGKNGQQKVAKQANEERLVLEQEKKVRGETNEAKNTDEKVKKRSKKLKTLINKVEQKIQDNTQNNQKNQAKPAKIKKIIRRKKIAPQQQNLNQEQDKKIATPIKKSATNNTSNRNTGQKIRKIRKPRRKNNEIHQQEQQSNNNQNNKVFRRQRKVIVCVESSQRQSERIQESEHKDANSNIWQKLLPPLVLDLGIKPQITATNQHFIQQQQQLIREIQEEENDHILQEQSVSNIWREHRQEYFSPEKPQQIQFDENNQQTSKKKNLSFCKAIDEKIQIIAPKGLLKKRIRGRPKRQKFQIDNPEKVPPFILTKIQTQSHPNVDQHLQIQQTSPLVQVLSEEQVQIQPIRSLNQNVQQCPRQGRKRKRRGKRSHSAPPLQQQYKQKVKRVRKKRSFAQIFITDNQLSTLKLVQQPTKNRQIQSIVQEVEALPLRQQLQTFKNNINYQMFIKKDGQMGIQFIDQNQIKCQVSIDQLQCRSPSWLKKFYQSFI